LLGPSPVPPRCIPREREDALFGPSQLLRPCTGKAHTRVPPSISNAFTGEELRGFVWNNLAVFLRFLSPPRSAAASAIKSARDCVLLAAVSAAAGRATGGVRGMLIGKRKLPDWLYRHSQKSELESVIA